MKKMIALLLALVFCFALFAACGEDTVDTTPATTTPADVETTQPTEAEYTAPDLTGVTIDFYRTANSDFDTPNCYATGAIEKTLGVDLNIVELDSFESVVKTMIAEKKPPELMFVNNYTHTNWAQYGLDGAFINFMDYIDQMPNFKAYMENPANASHVDKFQYSETEMYALPLSGEGSTTARAFLYRKDIFDKHNIEIPTNQEEFIACLRKLKELYPDSMPFVHRSLNNTNIQGAQALGHLFGASHVNRGLYGTFLVLDDDGNYYMAQTSQAYKEIAQFIVDLTAEGLMHSSSMTIDTAGWQEALASDTSFITYDKIDRIPQLTTQGKGLNPDYQIAAFAPFNLGSNASNPVVSTDFAAGATSYGFMVSAVSDEEDIKNILAYIDWLYSEEGILVTNWGIEGESYEVLEDGSFSYIDSFLEAQGGFTKTGLNKYGVVAYCEFEPFLDTCTEEMAKGLEMAQEFVGKTTKQYALTYNEEEQAVWDMYAESLYTTAQGEWSKFALGQKDFAEWDSFQKLLEDSYYYNEVKAIHESALERLLAE